MVALPLICLLLALEVGPSTSTAFTTYRTSEDNEAAADAAEAKEKDCDGLADGFSEDVDEKREALQNYIGSDENLILEILTESNNTNELSDKAQEKITAGWLIKTAGAMVFSFVLAFLWLIVCWTGCPCCKCCLCCRKQRRCGFIVKAIGLLSLGGLLLGMFITAMMALRGRDEIAAGMGKVSCTAANTMVNTLDGDLSQRFIGVLPMLDELGRIRSSMADNSDLMNSVSTIMSNTQDLERAQFVAAQALLLLEETLSLPQNKDAPQTSAAINQLLPYVQQVNSAISNGLSAALTNARAEVDNQLSSANRGTLRSAVDSAVEPLRSAADTVRDSMWFFIKDDFRRLKDTAIRSASAGIISIACVIFLLAACGCCSGVLCTFKDYNEADENPWNPNVHRCALTTWCCGFFYGFLVFFFGGLMVICAVPMASTCLVLDGIDSQMIRDILPALDAGGVGGDSTKMLTDIIDTCFSRTHQGPDQSLMDIVYFVESGNRTTLTEKLQGQLVNPIDQQFNTISQQLNSGNDTLATNSGVTSLKSTLLSFAWPSSAPPAAGFRCDIYNVPGALPGLQQACDVRDMSTTTWMPDCVSGTSPLAVTKREVLCNSGDFVTYINEWANRIDKVLRRVDSSVSSTGTRISTDLRAAVNQSVTSPVNNIVSNAYCSFLKQSYGDFINGFCFQGVYGFGFVARAYVANGVLTLFLIIIAYILWRIGLDNRDDANRTVRTVANANAPLKK